jgi:large subunit ribosomal protein L21
MIGGNHMYAIIATGGKQYKVSEGDVIKVEKLNAEKDATVTFDVVVVSKDSDVICGDAAKSATVKATVLGEGKAKKVVVYKYKPKTGYHKKNGHRQPYTLVKIDSINA